jgi:two-component system cell cycle response regulator
MTRSSVPERCISLVIAEKDDAITDQIERELARSGFRVLRAAEADDLSRALATTNVVMMRADGPGSDGLERCRKIRAAASERGVSLVLYGESGGTNGASWLEAGADDFLFLPFRSGEIAARIAVVDARSRLALAELESREELTEIRTELEDQRAQAEQMFSNLSVANSRFSELFQGLPVACYSYDEQGTIYEWNRAAIELTGYLPHEAFGKLIWQIFRVKGASGQRRNTREKKAAIQRIFAGETLLNIESTSYRKDGTSINILSNTFPIFTPDGQITGAISANIDISRRKALERQVAEQLEIANALNKELDAHRSELEAANTKLAALATIDGLTGLKNHRAFQEHLESEYQRARRSNGELSVVLLDVDKFKLYNDAFGHPAGDEVLKGVGMLLQSGVRKYDFVARYGGEEFIVILPNTGVETATMLAERLRTRIASADWPNRDVTASFGVATLTPDTANRKQLISESDAALYASKARGRNCVTHFTELPAEAQQEAA